MSKSNNTKRPDGAIVALSAALNITSSHCHKLLRAGMPDQIESAKVWREKQTAGDDSARRLRQERIALVQEQRQKIALENSARRGELIEISVVREGIIRIVSQAKMQFLRMPNDLPPRMEGQPAATISKILRAEIISILTELSADLEKPY